MLMVFSAGKATVTYRGFVDSWALHDAGGPKQGSKGGTHDKLQAHSRNNCL
jgi:hypothetical protein